MPARLATIGKILSLNGLVYRGKITVFGPSGLKFQVRELMISR